jgi:PKD-like domain
LKVLRLLLIGFLTCITSQVLYAQYTGSSNDGHSVSGGCAITLDGSSVFTLSTVSGSSAFCYFSSESYTVTAGGVNTETTFSWSVPAGATILSGQGTNTILVSFGNTDGNISVDVTNPCQTLSASLPVTGSTCTFYGGGSNDGFSTARNCATNLDGGSVFTISPITGSSTFCAFATESYSIVVTGATPTTTYTWSVPPGATITSGQGTTTILVTFANTDGNISVDVANECETQSTSLPVTSTSCQFYAGGTNDGSSSARNCATNLDGGSVFIADPIVGPATFCSFATESYSISVAGITATTTYTWSVPADATITSGQGTSTILVTFGGLAGSISVDIANECSTINVALPVSPTSCTFYSGGATDGFATLQQCATNLNGGSTFIPGPIAGPAIFCGFSSESYSINVAGALSTTVYNWSVPPGASIVSGQGTNTILVAFGNTSGNINVGISNECETIHVSLPVTAVSCTFYAGGSNDGFSTTRNCISNLGGGSAFIPGPVTGPASFCANSTEAYSIVVAGANTTTTYAWSVPVGATILSGQGTTTILVQFTTTGGNVTVTVANECESIPVSLPVSVTSCLFYAGGSNDGFSVTTVLNIPLPVELVSFAAKEESGTVALNWVTESELNNDFFVVERSPDGREFNSVVKVSGAGTSNERHTYFATDLYPYNGISYYRLLQQDFDGTKTYSKIIGVSVEANEDHAARVFPNPIIKRTELYLRCYNQINEIATITYVDSKGILVRTERINLTTGDNEVTLSPDFKSGGVYILLLKTHSGVKSIRLAVP